MIGLPCSICSYITYLIYVCKQLDVSTLTGFIKILYYRTQKKAIHIFRVEGINKESRQFHVYKLRLREELFSCIFAVRHS